MTETTTPAPTDPAVLLAAYDEQLRGASEGSSVPTSTDGPVIRVEYPTRGFVSYRSLEGLGAEELDALIGRQRDYFAALGQAVEWKTRGHDLPADLTDRLLAAGFRPEERETVVIAESAVIAARLGAHRPIEHVTIRSTTDRRDLEGIARMESAVWGEEWDWLADDLERRIAEHPDLIDVYVAEVGGEIVSAAWSVHKQGTDFTCLWGGSTLAEWRGNGIYKALVAVRAQRAVERGTRYLQVDASDDSAPILQRLGFTAVTTTTPYVFTPPAG